MRKAPSTDKHRSSLSINCTGEGRERGLPSSPKARCRKMLISQQPSSCQQISPPPQFLRFPTCVVKRQVKAQKSDQGYRRRIRKYNFFFNFFYLPSYV